MEGVLARDNLGEDAGGDDHDQLEQYHIVSRRQWEQKYVHCLRMKQCMLLVHSSNGINLWKQEAFLKRKRANSGKWSTTKNGCQKRKVHN